MKKILKLKKINDPGHGWLSVPLKLLKELGIEKEISQYSYMTLSRAYLEEDSDMSIFINKIKELGIEASIKILESEKTSIRSMASFNERFIDFALTLGVDKEVVLYNSSEKDWSLNGSISSEHKSYFMLRSDNGGYYKIDKTMALNYIRPIRERVDEYNMEVIFKDDKKENLNIRIIYQGGLYGLEQKQKHRGKVPLVEIKQENGETNTFYVETILGEKDKIVLSNNNVLNKESLDVLHNWMNDLKKLQARLEHLTTNEKRIKI